MTETLSAEAFVQAVKWDRDGLVPAIAQDAKDGRVLMMAWMNVEALKRTLAEGRAIYWSRSRGELWRKGDTSGHSQTIKEIWIDCDGDTILMKVEQIGPACHTGAETCFFRKFGNAL